MNKPITIATASVLCLLAGCKNTSGQGTEHSGPGTALPSGADTLKPDRIEIDYAEYPPLNKVLELPNGTICTMLPLPLSLNRYLKYYSKFVAHQPADTLVSFLKSIGFEGSEYHCHLFPFKPENILPMLVWICRGDSEYYLIVTADAGQGTITGHLPAGESTDNGIISFHIDEDFRITRFKAETVYNEPAGTYDIVDKERLDSYRIGEDGRISKESKPTDR